MQAEHSFNKYIVANDMMQIKDDNHGNRPERGHNTHEAESHYQQKNERLEQ